MAVSVPVHQLPKIAYVVDPRFRGGTSSAVAAELEVACRLARIEVHALSTTMFSGQSVAPQLGDALARLKIPLIWDAPEIAADLVIFHNPSCLKFQSDLTTRILTPRLIVVTHENFLRPGGAEGFDVAACLDQIAKGSVTVCRQLAPISPWNRATVQDWLAAHDSVHPWAVLDHDWFNICAFDFAAPTKTPADRRGRHSRPGFEKFPQPGVMHQCFPQSAQSNVILGADSFLRDGGVPAHWMAYPFGGLSVPEYLEKIDFFVYFTASTWRESFGRVLAEAIAAGKIAITDPDTARTFDGAAVAATPEEVDGIVQRYIQAPETYQADVRAAQQKLHRFSPRHFEKLFAGVLPQMAGGGG